MCGRYASFREAQDLADAFDIDEFDDDARSLAPSWNIAPTQGVRIVTERLEEVSDVDGQSRTSRAIRTLRLARWGLVPPWATDPTIGSRLINARIESIAQKASFKRALMSRRCAVPAEGYYEWQPAASGKAEGTSAVQPAKPTKTPYYLSPEDGAPAIFAGLYEFWRDPARGPQDRDRWLVTTTIITAPAVPELAYIHDRRPVALDLEHLDAWLSPSITTSAEALAVLDFSGPRFAPRRVASLVNAVRNDGPELVVETMV